MNRRNFIGNLMAIGAGFTILPSASTHDRIWVPSREIITQTVGSIWKEYYISQSSMRGPEECATFTEFREASPPLQSPSLGQVRKHDGKLWYGTPVKWLKLEKFTNPLTWPVTSIGLEPVKDNTPVVIPAVSTEPLVMPEII